MKKSLFVTVLSLPLVFSLFAATAAQGQPLDQKTLARIYKEVRHELVMLPYYGVFDNLSLQGRRRRDGDTVGTGLAGSRAHSQV